MQAGKSASRASETASTGAAICLADTRREGGTTAGPLLQPPRRSRPRVLPPPTGAPVYGSGHLCRVVGITKSSLGLFVRSAAPDVAAISRVEAGCELESTLPSL